MGLLANDMVSGLSCSHCGTYFEKEHGYPVLCTYCWKTAKPTERQGYSKALFKEL